MTVLSGMDFANRDRVSTVTLTCPWCERTAAIEIGAQHVDGNVDYHCGKCSRYSSHKVADKFFDEYNQKMREYKDAWKRVPASAYVTVRQSRRGTPSVVTIYLGKGRPEEFFSRDTVEHILTEEFGISWPQANDIINSAALQMGRKIFFRDLLKIASQVDDKMRKVGDTPEATLKVGQLVLVNGKEAVFLRESAYEGFVIVAMPGLGDAEVPVVDLKVIDVGRSPEEVGFEDFELEEMEEMGLAEDQALTIEDIAEEVAVVREHVEQLLQHEEGETEEGFGEDEEREDLSDASEYLQETEEHLELAQEKIEEFVGSETEEVESEDFEFEPEGDEFEESEEPKKAAFDPNRDKIITLENLLNDPNVDPETKALARKKLIQLKTLPSAPKVYAKHIARIVDTVTDEELEGLKRPEQNFPQADNSVTESSELYPKEDDKYPKKVKKDDENASHMNEDHQITKHEKSANRDAQRRVHTHFAHSRDLKRALTVNRPELSISDIREILGHFKNTGKIDSIEENDLARWFIGEKPRLLSANDVTARKPDYACGDIGRQLNDCKKITKPKFFHRPKAKTADAYEQAGWKKCPRCTHSVHQSDMENGLCRSCAKFNKEHPKSASLQLGIGIGTYASNKGKRVLVLAMDNTGNNATVTDGNAVFSVDSADLSPWVDVEDEV